MTRGAQRAKNPVHVGDGSRQNRNPPLPNERAAAKLKMQPPQQMFTGGKTNFADKTGRHSIQQGAAARSMNTSSVGGFQRTPITVVKPRAKGKVSPMDILAAPQRGGK